MLTVVDSVDKVDRVDRVDKFSIVDKIAE